MRAVFDNLDEANSLAESIQKTENLVSTHVCLTGHWLEWDPDPNKIVKQKYANNKLNEIFSGKDDHKRRIAELRNNFK